MQGQSGNSTQNELDEAEDGGGGRGGGFAGGGGVVDRRDVAGWFIRSGSGEVAGGQGDTSG